MSNAPTSISALILMWPTFTEFAAEVGCGYEAARQMRTRGRIAARYWPSLVAAAKARDIDGVTFEWLAQQHAPQTEAAE